MEYFAMLILVALVCNEVFRPYTPFQKGWHYRLIVYLILMMAIITYLILREGLTK